MKRAHLLSLFLVIILLAATVSLLLVLSQPSARTNQQVYVGVAFGGTTVDQAKLMIDRVKGYTNLFVLDSGLNPISSNRTLVEEVCDYAIKTGLNIIVNLGTYTPQDWSWKSDFYNYSREHYGDKFLGVYYDDDVGGVVLDWNWPKEFATQDNPIFWGTTAISRTLVNIHYKLQISQILGVQPENYSQEAQFLSQLIGSNKGLNSLKQNQLYTLTSDYGLYWFDYLGGYNAMLAQFGFNNSVDQQIALVRGAATMQNKDWGAIITWRYKQPDRYLDSGENIYNQMKTAYNAGAKYILLFDYPYNVTNSDGTLNQYGTLRTEHFQALQDFWNKVFTKPPTSTHAEAVLVLPKDYGWGFRNPTDKIWGFWGPDDKSPIIWSNTQTLLQKYGSRLDIIYDDPAFPIQGNYSKIYYWNQTIN